MPNQPKTPVRTVRVSDDLWDELKKLAVSRGVSVSDVLRELIERELADR